MKTVANRTKPARVREDSIPLAQALANASQTTTPEVIHNALVEYFENHHDEFAANLARAQRAFATGQLDEVTAMLSTSAEMRVQEFAEHCKD